MNPPKEVFVVLDANDVVWRASANENVAKHMSDFTIDQFAVKPYRVVRYLLAPEAVKEEKA